MHKLSNHPNNIPKGQFIRIRRICSEKDDYMNHWTVFLNSFIKRGYEKTSLQNTIMEVSNIERGDLLKDKTDDKRDFLFVIGILFYKNYHHY